MCLIKSFDCVIFLIKPAKCIIINFFQVISLTLVAAAFGQGYHGDPRTAAILAEDRYLQADGRFGAQYQQEDGVNFKEESSPDGTRRGSYSYVDPNGQRHTIRYIIFACYYILKSFWLSCQN